MSLNERQLVKPTWPYTINHDSQQAQGLIAWWPATLFGGNRLYDLVTGVADGAITGAVWADGLRFDGTDDVVDAGTLLAFDGNNWTMHMVYTVGAGGDVGFNRFFSYYDPTFWNEGVGNVSIVHSGTVDFDCGFAQVAGVLRYVTVTRAGTTITAYLNGRQTAQNTSFSTTLTKTGNMYIGRGNSFAEYAPMDFYEARIYNRGLSAGEVWALYDPLTRYDLYWELGRRSQIQLILGGYYLLENGTDRYLLENASGLYLLEETQEVVGEVFPAGYSRQWQNPLVRM